MCKEEVVQGRTVKEESRTEQAKPGDSPDHNRMWPGLFLHMDVLMLRAQGCAEAVLHMDAPMLRAQGCAGAVLHTDVLMLRAQGCAGAVSPKLAPTVNSSSTPDRWGKVSDTSNPPVFSMPARASTRLMDSGLRRNNHASETPYCCYLRSACVQDASSIITTPTVIALSATLKAGQCHSRQ